jgi:hypothetical protein
MAEDAGGGSPRLNLVREDVHLHVPLDDVRARLTNLAEHERWLSSHFLDFTAEGEACTFRLSVPLRTEEASLRLERQESGAVVFARDGAGSIASMTWALHPEGRNESHLTVEIAYEPATGVAGLLEPLVHRPHRGQALRDSLWNLKQLYERDRPANGASPL